MNWLCRIGLHRWEFVSGRDATDPMIYITHGRCRRRCARYGEWRAVDKSRWS